MKKGDWVQAWGQVRKIDEPGVHPEDVLVEFFSHNEQWAGHVRLDRVVEVDQDSLPGFIGTCTAMHETKSGAYRRCVLHERHGDYLHQDNKGSRWDNSFTVGHFEES